MLDLMNEEGFIDAKDIPVNNDQEYISTLLGVMSADDKKSKYDINFNDKYVDKDKYIIHNLRVNKFLKKKYKKKNYKIKIVKKINI